MSNCDPETGQQIGPPGLPMPPCVPVFHGTNGGATMKGVDADEVRFVVYAYPTTPYAEHLLDQTGYAMTADQQCFGFEAWTGFVNKYFERYGRTLVSMDGPGEHKGSTAQDNCDFPYFVGRCNQAPPDHPCYRAEAAAIAALDPAFVIAQPTFSFVDELVRRGIPVLGGGAYPAPLYEQSAPYLYGVSMDSTRAMNLAAEYWCKNLNGRPAEFAGADVRQTRNWGDGVGQVPTRKLGILYANDPGDPTPRQTLDYFTSLVTGGRCDTPGGVVAIGYSPIIETAQTQAVNIAQQFIQEHVTTVMCLCDFVTPVFWTQGMTQQGYFPEHYLGAVPGLDNDQIARLYDQEQWQHAFGVSQLTEPVKPLESDSWKVFRDMDCQGCNDKWPAQILDFNFHNFYVMGVALQSAGPSPTAADIHAGLLAQPHIGGWAETRDPRRLQFGLDGDSPWTFYKDVRLVYWNRNRPSDGDDRAGSYCPVQGGQRYLPGQFPSEAASLMFNSGTNGC